MKLINTKILQTLLIIFLSVAERLNHNVKHSSGKNNSINNPKYYVSEISNKPFANIKFNNTSTRKIGRIINSLKINTHMPVMKSQQKY
jgi:hypothetical protein